MACSAAPANMFLLTHLALVITQIVDTHIAGKLYAYREAFIRVLHVLSLNKGAPYAFGYVQL